jgi:hypothetical protein
MDRFRSPSRRRLGQLVLTAFAAAAACRPTRAQTVREGDLFGRPIFVPLDRIVVSVFRGRHVERHEMLLIKLELMNSSAITPLDLAMPRLRDSFVRIWNRLGSRPDAADKGLDVEAGRRAMQAACDELVGLGRIKNVLIVAHSSRLVRQQPGMGS